MGMVVYVVRAVGGKTDGFVVGKGVMLMMLGRDAEGPSSQGGGGGSPSR
jgi:hypothetical protein